MSDDQRRKLVEVPRARCPFCRDEVGPDEAKQACGDCMAWHHQTCWTEHGGCSTCGREAQAVTQGARCAWPECDAPPSDLEDHRPVPLPKSQERVRPGRLCLSHLEAALKREDRLVYLGAVCSLALCVLGGVLFSLYGKPEVQGQAPLLIAAGPFLSTAVVVVHWLQRSAVLRAIADRGSGPARSALAERKGEALKGEGPAVESAEPGA